MTGRIEKAPWADFFTDLAKTPHGYEARLEIIGRAFGDQEAAAWLPFMDMSYDPHQNQICITVGGISSRYPVHLTHTINEPTMVHVRRTPDGAVQSILIVSGDKTETLVHLQTTATACGLTCHPRTVQYRVARSSYIGRPHEHVTPVRAAVVQTGQPGRGRQRPQERRRNHGGRQRLFG